MTQEVTPQSDSEIAERAKARLAQDRQIIETARKSGNTTVLQIHRILEEVLYEVVHGTPLYPQPEPKGK